MEAGGFLSAKWWRLGDEIACIFNRTFETKYGLGYEFILVKPSTITIAVDQFGSSYKKDDPEIPEGCAIRPITRFSIPPLAGFDMALQDMKAGGFPGFQFGDKCIIKCTDIQASKDFGFSDMPMFELSVDPR